MDRGGGAMSSPQLTSFNMCQCVCQQNHLKLSLSLSEKEFGVRRGTWAEGENGSTQRFYNVWIKVWNRFVQAQKLLPCFDLFNDSFATKLPFRAETDKAAAVVLWRHQTVTNREEDLHELCSSGGK